MNPINTGKIESGLYALRTKFVNMFLVATASGYLCIDTGLKAELVKVELEKLSINPELVSHVFLTHSDYDHVGAIGLFNNAKVLIPSEEEQMISGRTARKFKIYFNKRLKCAYSTVNGGDTIECDGVSVECIATPGHTAGSMSFLVDHKYLFTGDAVKLKNGEILPFYISKNMDNKKARAAAHKIRSLNKYKLLCTAHTGIKYLE